MYLLSRLFLFLTNSADAMQKAREEAYLAEAIDIYDLEFRLSEIDREKTVRHPAWMGQR